MITWDDNLWCSEELKGKAARIRRRLRWRKATAAATWCITLAVNKENLFDIYNMGELLFRYYRDSDDDIHIVGLADSREAACELAASMIEKVYDQTGRLDVRGYFSVPVKEQ